MRQLTIFGVSELVRPASLGLTFALPAGDVDCQCGMRAHLVIIGRRWYPELEMGGPVFGNDCCEFHCSSCDVVHCSYDGYAHECSNCEECSDCCECAYCESCCEMVTETNICQRCDDCCECAICNRCDDHTDYTCGRCERCEQCCYCLHCSDCGEATDESEWCAHCDECSYCCQCDGDDSDDYEVSTVATYNAGTHESTSGRTFGVELEHIGNPRRSAAAVRAAGIACAFKGYTHSGCHEWKAVTDASISDGGEIVSAILRGADGLAQLETVTLALLANDASVDSSCGTHVHIGCEDLTAAEIAKVAKYYNAHAALIDLLHAPSRRGTSSWSGPYHDHELDSIDAVAEDSSATDEQRKRRFGGLARYRSVNLTAFPKYGTLEFRQHAGTLNYRKLSAWIAFLMALITSAVNDEGTSGDLVELMETLCDYGLTRDHAEYLLARAEDLSQR